MQHIFLLPFLLHAVARNSIPLAWLSTEILRHGSLWRIHTNSGHVTALRLPGGQYTQPCADHQEHHHLRLANLQRGLLLSCVAT